MNLNPFRKKTATTKIPPVIDTDSVQSLQPTTGMEYGAQPTTAASLIPMGKRGARSRQQIYDKWMLMESDPLVSTCIKLLSTAALGGHETTGQLVFIEPKPWARKDKKKAKMVEEIAATITPILDAVAYQLAYTGAAYGDSYVRVYSEKGKGVLRLYADELVRPQIVQPYERAGDTVGYAVYVGERSFERLTSLQMARLKMPRVQYIPQHGIMEKATRLSLVQDDIMELPIVPSSVGGSLLYNAEPAWENLVASLAGMNGGRILDTIQEHLFTPNMANMTEKQQEKYIESFVSMLTRSKQLAEQAISDGNPVLGRVYHILPTWDEKQMAQQGQALGAPRSSVISVDDVMVNARLLTGAFGVDLSVVGFADQMGGSLGEGGIFRVSGMVAEAARVIRVAGEDCFNQIINIHCMQRYGMAFEPKDMPWDVNFYGSLSARESEEQRTQNDAMAAGMTLVQAMQGLKELGASTDTAELFLAKTMRLDDDLAKEYAKIMDSKPPDQGVGMMGGAMPEDEVADEEPDVEESTDESV